MITIRLDKPEVELLDLLVKEKRTIETSGTAVDRQVRNLAALGMLVTGTERDFYTITRLGGLVQRYMERNDDGSGEVEIDLVGTIGYVEEVTDHGRRQHVIKLAEDVLRHDWAFGDVQRQVGNTLTP